MSTPFSFPTPQHPQQTQLNAVDRLALILGGNRRIQQCQEQIYGITTDVTERWKLYHTEQVTAAALQKECDDLRSQAYSLQMKLAEKLVEHRNTTLEAEHSLRHINTMLAQSQTLHNEIDIAKNNLATMTGVQTFAPPPPPPLLSTPSQANTDDHNDLVKESPKVVIKRERDERDERDESGDTRRDPRVYKRATSYDRDICSHFNSHRGCFYPTTCKHRHVCSICTGHDHGRVQCDVKIYDRRR